MFRSRRKGGGRCKTGASFRRRASLGVEELAELALSLVVVVLVAAPGGRPRGGELGRSSRFRSPHCGRGTGRPRGGCALGGGRTHRLALGEGFALGQRRALGQWS